MRTFKFQIIFGLILLITGFIFDFGFLAPSMSNAFKTDPVPYLNSWSRHLYEFTKFYVIVLGLLNIALPFLKLHFASSPKLDWTILGLMVSGSIILIAAGLWYASAGPSFKWELRCTVLSVGLFAILLGLGLEIYKLLSGKNLQE